MNELGLEQLQAEQEIISVYFWGILYVLLLLGIPAYLSWKELKKTWRDPLKISSPAWIFLKALILYIPLGYTLAQLLIALGDEIGFRASYYLHLFIQYLNS